MKAEELAKLRTLAERATPGSWKVDTVRHGGAADRVRLDDEVRTGTEARMLVAKCYGSVRWAEHNARFIAAASPSVVLRMIERLEVLTGFIGTETEHHAELLQFKERADKAEAERDALRIVAEAMKMGLWFIGNTLHGDECDDLGVEGISEAGCSKCYGAYDRLRAQVGELRDRASRLACEIASIQDHARTQQTASIDEGWRVSLREIEQKAYAALLANTAAKGDDK